MHTTEALLQKGLANSRKRSESVLLIEDKDNFVSIYKHLKETFLLALDLLDRKVVTFFPAEEGTGYDIYQVTSTNPKFGRTVNVVRLNAWSCTCPNFTFNAFYSEIELCACFNTAQNEGVENCDWHWGGIADDGKHEPPFCKHILACFIAHYGGERFEQYRQTGTPDELAF